MYRAALLRTVGASMLHWLRVTALLAASSSAATVMFNCGSDGYSPDSDSTSGSGDSGITQSATYTIGGTVSGLSGALVLQNNSGDNLELTADGTFTFATALADTSAYAVTILTQPLGQSCAASSSSGTLAGVDVTAVSISCTNSFFTVGGSMSGLSGTVVLQDNGSNDLTVTLDGTFVFSASLAMGNAYTVAVKTQPSGQLCTVTNASGTVASSNVTTVSVSCVSNLATIGGSVGGLSGTLVLQNNVGDDLTITQNGVFTFGTSVTKGETYAVTVQTQPAGQSCTVSNDSGTASANVSNVTVSCGNTYGLSLTVGGAGNGSVTSDQGSINCMKSSGTCSSVYNDGTSVVLTAAADTGYLFSGWSGSGCTGTGTCTVVLSAAKTVRATFIMVTFDSALKTDGTNAANTNNTNNIWLVKTDGTGLTALTNTTASGAGSTRARWSHDGTKIVFASSRNPNGTDSVNTTTNTGIVGLSTSNIWVINSDGTGLTALTNITAASTIVSVIPMWSPDDSKIAFYSQRNLDGSNSVSSPSVYNIWIMNADGTGLTALTRTTVTGTDNNTPQWSPDGTKILFSSKRNLDGTNTGTVNTVPNIWVINVDGTGLTALTTLTTAGTNSTSPLWSPDGTKIAFQSTRKVDGTDALNTGSSFNVWMMNADGSGLTALTQVTASSANSIVVMPWSPDGTKLLFYSKRNLDGTTTGTANAANNIWVINTDGTGLTALTALTTSGADSLFPQWSPDGSKITFYGPRKTDGTNALNTNSVGNIWIMNSDGTGLTALTTATAASASSEIPSMKP